MKFGVPLSFGGAMFWAGALMSPVAAAPSSVHQQAVSRAADPFAAGKAALQRHDYKAAVRYFKTAIAKREHVIDAEIGLGSASLSLGDFSTAFQAYTRAAVFAPKNPAAAYGAADASLYYQQYHAAVDYASQYIGLRPRDPNGYRLRFLAEGRLAEAKLQLRDARVIIRLQPHQSESFNDLGIALGNVGQNHAAIGAFSSAIKLQPKYAPYYINRAIVENLAKQQRQALADLQTARRLTTDSATRKNLDQAIAKLKKRMGR
ncbi:MAG: hypothetical protein M3Z66_25405 [Chloroflexota bacterium]|nr:hypothetical protein [Chloroflexota bacterium]